MIEKLLGDGESGDGESAGEILEPDSDQSKKPPVEEVAEEFRQKYPSDEKMIEGGIAGSFFHDYLEFGKKLAENTAEMFEAHDEERIEDAYRAGGLFFSMSFTHIDVEDRVKAGYGYVDALFEKDRIEEKYRNEEGELDSERMAKEDGLNHSSIEIDHGEEKVKFEEEDLGEWVQVYKGMSDMAEKTIENFYDENAEEKADYEALLRTLAWRNHKVGEYGHPERVYDSLNTRAHNMHLKASLQNEEYPQKHSEDGENGPGYLAAFWLKLVELHDQYRRDEEQSMRLWGMFDLGRYGRRLNRKRRENEELERAY